MASRGQGPESAGSPIVAIGASAGGIEPLLQIVADLPPEFPAALLVVVHMPSARRSVLPRILASAGRLPASFARDGQLLQRGRIYVAPADRHLLVKDGRASVLRGSRENGSRPAIDPLFRSAALSHDSRAIGVVLSGSLDDGALGLAAIKARGGVAIVQDPNEAKYPSMPLSATRSTIPDYCLRAGEIASVLSREVAKMIERGAHYGGALWQVGNPGTAYRDGTASAKDADGVDDEREETG